jgi:hypothetical protein
LTVAVGVDIGNSTTEVVLARLSGSHVGVVATDQVQTRGAKGSPASVDAAAALVERLSRRTGLRVDVAVVAPLRPVETSTAVVPTRAADTGRLLVVRAGAPTAGGNGVAVGRPVPVGATTASGSDPVVVTVPAEVGYRDAVAALRPLLDAGRLAGVVLAQDEAVLVANRIGRGVPVVDGVAVGQLSDASLVVVESRPAGELLRALTDPLWLTARLGLSPAERSAAAQVAAMLADVSNAVVARYEEDPGVGRDEVDRREGDDDADDVFFVDLDAVTEGVLARRGSYAGRAYVRAALLSKPVLDDPAAALGERLGVETLTVPSEAAAARMGALTTPGADDGTLVVDVGGGTLDVVDAEGATVVAGAGEMLTVATAHLLGVSRALGEWAKRGPARRVEAPQVLLGEDGSRTLTERPAPADSVGWLVTDGPAGLLRFDRAHAPSEWRALRLRLKTDVVGANVARAMAALGRRPSSLVVVGGAAADDEVLSCVARGVREAAAGAADTADAVAGGVAVGRGNVAGSLGHRYAVAYGLLLALTAHGTTAPRAHG